MPSGVYDHVKLRKKIKVICSICGSIFHVIPSIIKRGCGKFCSSNCQIVWQRTTGRKNGVETPNWKGGRIEKKCRICKSIFLVYFNGKGKYCSRECSNIGLQKDNPTYRAMHSWVQRQLGTPNICKHCGIKDSRRYDWANISKEYKRNLNDWIRLCHRCHFIYDDVANKAWKTRKHDKISNGSS
jgi:hypothetical protein